MDISTKLFAVIFPLVLIIAAWSGLTLAMWFTPSSDMPRDPTLEQVLQIQANAIDHKLHKLW